MKPKSIITVLALIAFLFPQKLFAAEMYAVIKDSIMTFYYDNLRTTRNGWTYVLDEWIEHDFSEHYQWIYTKHKEINTAVFHSSFKNAQPTNTSEWFYNCQFLRRIYNIEYLNTERVTNMGFMFARCFDLDELDVSHFNTGNVKSMDNMFRNSRSLSYLDVSNFNTRNVINMTCMFSGCSGLKSIDVSNFVTDNVLTMYSMFGYCESIENLDVSCFNTTKVKDMSSMFCGCLSLKEIDVSGFNTKNVTNMDGMFERCTSLTSIFVGSFNTSNVTNMGNMFSSCTALKTIYTVEDWNTEKVGSSENMFKECINLIGGQGTTFSEDKTDVGYAHIDKGSANPGYFTEWKGNDPVGKAYAVLDNGVLTFYFDDLANTRTGRKFGINGNKVGMPDWIYARGSIKKASFDASFANYYPRNTAYWFYNCYNMTEIEHMENLSTDSVRSMTAMFRFCYELNSLDVSHFNTEKAEDMSFMFCFCQNLRDIDVTHFNTDNVVDMQHMFHTCPVEELNLRSFNTSKVKDTNTMFADCQKVKTIYASRERWDNQPFEQSAHMFQNCNNLTGGCGTKFTHEHTNKEYAIIDEGISNPGYLTDAPLPSAYAVLEDSVLTFYYDKYKNEREGNVYPIERDSLVGNTLRFHNGWHESGSSYTALAINKVVFHKSFEDYYPSSTAWWFYGGERISSIEGLEHLNTSRVDDMSGMFEGCIVLTSLDVSQFQTKRVKNMARMFSNCKSLSSLDVSHFDTSKVKDMQRMFFNCSSLSELDVRNFDTSCTTNMSWMFGGSYTAIALKELDVLHFDTSNVTEMRGMFCNCSLLNHLDVTHFNTSKVTTMENMFSGCTSLLDLDVTNFNTSNVTNMGYMFHGCKSLTQLDITHFDTSKVTDMGSMFSMCSSLSSFDVSNFNTSNVTNMYAMFEGCSELTSLDLHSFNTQRVYWMTCMFVNCTSLHEIDLRSFNTSMVGSMTGMFKNCSSLKHLSIGNFKSSNIEGDVSLGALEEMFSGCSALTELDISGIENCGGKIDKMFNGCHSLKILDLSKFDTSHTIYMRSLFCDCQSITTIYVGDNWKPYNQFHNPDGYQMFEGCINLKGSSGTVYDLTHTDYTYAHIDGGPENPGYLTYKAKEIPTDIEYVEQGDEKGIWYNMQGIRIKEPTKAGIYMKDGKKIVVK